MKKIIALALVFIFLPLCLAACGEKEKIYRISLGDEEISLSESSALYVYCYAGNPHFTDTDKYWNISTEDSMDFLFSILSDTESEVCRFEPVGNAVNHSALKYPRIQLTLEPEDGREEDLLMFYLEREKSRVYVTLQTWESVKNAKNADEMLNALDFYYIDAPKLEELFKQYYDGHICTR